MSFLPAVCKTAQTEANPLTANLNRSEQLLFIGLNWQRCVWNVITEFKMITDYNITGIQNSPRLLKVFNQIQLTTIRRFFFRNLLAGRKRHFKIKVLHAQEQELTCAKQKSLRKSGERENKSPWHVCAKKLKSLDHWCTNILLQRA